MAYAHLGHMRAMSRDNKAKKEKNNKECISFVYRHFPHYYRTEYYDIAASIAPIAIPPHCPANPGMAQQTPAIALLQRTLGPLFSFMFSFWKLSFPSPGYSQTFLPSGATSYVGGIADTPDKRPNEINGHNRLDQAAPLLTQAHSQPSVYSLLRVLTAVY